jgi:hypothetical protein
MPEPIFSALMAIRGAAVSAVKRGLGWWRQRGARADALTGANLSGRGGIRSLVEERLRQQSTLSEDDLPGSDVDAAVFGDWLRDSDNLEDFVRAYIARSGQEESADPEAEARLSAQYIRRAARPVTNFPKVLQLVVSYIHGDLEATESAQRKLDRALIRRTAAGVARLADDSDPIEHVHPFAAALVEAGKRSWKMPRFIAPLTLEAYEEREGAARLTGVDELPSLIAEGTPILLHGAGGIGKTTPPRGIRGAACLDRQHRSRGDLCIHEYSARCGTSPRASVLSVHQSDDG